MKSSLWGNDVSDHQAGRTLSLNLGPARAVSRRSELGPFALGQRWLGVEDRAGHHESMVGRRLATGNVHFC